MHTLPLGILGVLTVAVCATAQAQAAPFKLSSSTFADNGKILVAQGYDKDGCGGGNTSPALKWSGTPTGTKSLAIIMFDPDADKGKGYTHWVVYGLDATKGGISEGAGKQGASGMIQGKSGFPIPAYGGPCPPVGDPPHHYVFTAYALDLTPNALPTGLDKDGLLSATKGHTLGTTQLTGLYQRTAK